MLRGFEVASHETNYLARNSTNVFRTTVEADIRRCWRGCWGCVPVWTAAEGQNLSTAHVDDVLTAVHGGRWWMNSKQASSASQTYRHRWNCLVLQGARSLMSTTGLISHNKQQNKLVLCMGVPRVHRTRRTWRPHILLGLFMLSRTARLKLEGAGTP